jgi:N-acetylglutamate synthase-like GNAT family acetyltransferase
MNGKRVIQQVKKDTLETVLAIINETNRVSYKAIIPPKRFKDPFMSLDELEGEAKRMDFFLCEEDGQAIGVGALEDKGSGIGVVFRLYVLPAFQRSGVGSALLSHIERHARRSGISEILVWTDSKAVWAVSFYKRQGYAEVEPTTRYGDPIIDARIRRHGRDLVVLCKCLT